jgi:hypothetical protein
MERDVAICLIPKTLVEGQFIIALPPPVYQLP